MTDKEPMEMATSRIYAREKFWDAVYILAAGKDNLNERLIEAMHPIRKITMGECPAEISEDIDELMSSILGGIEESAGNTIQDAILRMSPDEASRHAKEIVNLCCRYNKL